ncbi:LysR family transcriptional regulator [Streptosporangium oxazolinicum]|uniref:LysR family transcriptional regulator n=2 Tax=Streptosporangium oxazolinicum TaxID=909287 RepID=A0ABP8ALJ8_9ACTN
MRAFVVASEELHFTRAAERLFLSQQALSKRIRRLEDALSVTLFERTTRRVVLTASGRRLLPLVKEAVDAFDNAVQTAKDTGGRLLIDIHDERFTPLRIVRAVSEREPGLQIEASMRQAFPVAVRAVRGREIDAGFGRVHDLGQPWPSTLQHRLVHLEPIHVYVPLTHRLADRPVLKPHDLRGAGVAMPDPGEASEWRGYLARFARYFGIPLHYNEPALGIEHLIEQIHRERHAVALGEAGIRLAGDSGLRRIPLTGPEVPYPWSIVWDRRNTSANLGRLLALMPAPTLPAQNDQRTWIPDVDRRHPSNQSG